MDFSHNTPQHHLERLATQSFVVREKAASNSLGRARLHRAQTHSVLSWGLEGFMSSRQAERVAAWPLTKMDTIAGFIKRMLFGYEHALV